MDATPPNTNPLAWLSLVLGVLAPLTCGATAPFALLFGFLALRRVNLSDGRLAGARAARAGMVLGAIGIVLFFAGLFVVGLYELRGKSEATVCTNNLRRIGLAVNLYHEAKDHPHYPTGTVVIPELDPDQRLSWMVSILPYMESEPGAGAPAPFRKGETLYGHFDLKKGWHGPANQEAIILAWFVCPAGRSVAPAGTDLTTYVGIGGLGTLSPTFPKTDPRAGFIGWDRVITRDDVTRGTAETMMVTERAHDLGPWPRGGWGTVTGVDPAAQPYVPRQFGGLHPHGANVLFADAHVNFVTDRANPVVWEEQCRIKRDE
jgi:prepilin-type processing-associated H-X9-DG protein